MTASPADAVREALDNLVQLIAREYGVTLEVHQRVAAVKNAMKQAEAKAEDHARDASRYRWLRNQHDEKEWPSWHVRDAGGTPAPIGLDAAIDAEMEGEL